MPYFAYVWPSNSNAEIIKHLRNGLYPRSKSEEFPVIQTCLTLDEYCNPDLDPEDLTKRNDDQVVARSIMRSQRAPNSKENKDSYSGPLLMVPQVWIWKFGGHVVTSGAPEDRGTWAMLRPDTDDQIPHDEQIGIILSACIDSLVKPVPGLWQPLLTIFARSIAVTSEDVTKYLDNDEMSNIEIEAEKQFLHEIEDIREEISMIQTVLLEQEEVWREFAFSTWPDYWPTGPEGKFKVPRDKENDRWKLIQRPQQQLPKFKRRLKKLDDDAERVQRSIELKLDLKQKHASLQLARSGSIMSAAVFGFTIITVIFTPLSFIVGLLALPVDKFQQNQVQVEGGDTSVYSTWYIGTWISESQLSY